MSFEQINFYYNTDWNIDKFFFLQVTVFYSSYSAGRDERLFQDPMNFDPDRWKRDEMHAFAIQPFGFGPRGCYGKLFCSVYKLGLPIILIGDQSQYQIGPRGC